jgi:hypothetical protein
MLIAHDINIKHFNFHLQSGAVRIEESLVCIIYADHVFAVNVVNRALTVVEQGTRKEKKLLPVLAPPSN